MAQKPTNTQRRFLNVQTIALKGGYLTSGYLPTGKVVKVSRGEVGVRNPSAKSGGKQ